MLTNDLPSVRHLLKAAVETAARQGASVIDADDEIAALCRLYPNGLPFDENDLRKEVAELAANRGIAVKMGGR